MSVCTYLTKLVTKTETFTRKIMPCCMMIRQNMGSYDPFRGRNKKKPTLFGEKKIPFMIMTRIFLFLPSEKSVFFSSTLIVVVSLSLMSTKLGLGVVIGMRGATLFWPPEGNSADDSVVFTTSWATKMGFRAFGFWGTRSWEVPS